MTTKGTRKRTSNVFQTAAREAKRLQYNGGKQLAAQAYRGRFTSGSGPEIKNLDTALSFAIDGTGEVPATGQLVLIPQGVTDVTRVGRKCVIKSIQIRAVLTYAPGAAGTATTQVNLFLVQDTQTNGAAAAVTDVMSGTDLTVAMRNLTNIGRFKVLRTFTFNFTSPAGVSAAYNNECKPWTYYTRCSIPLEFSSTTGAIGELRTNNLFLLAGSNAAGDDLVGCTGLCRVRFSDGS